MLSLLDIFRLDVAIATENDPDLLLFYRKANFFLRFVIILSPPIFFSRSYRTINHIAACLPVLFFSGDLMLRPAGCYRIAKKTGTLAEYTGNILYLV